MLVLKGLIRSSIRGFPHARRKNVQINAIGSVFSVVYSFITFSLIIVIPCRPIQAVLLYGNILDESGWRRSSRLCE